MAAKTQGGGGIISVTNKEVLIGAPGTMGSFPALVEPDDGGGQWDAKFKYRHHMTPDQVARLEVQLQSELDKAWPKFEKAAKDAGKKPGEMPSAAEWLADQLKEPGEKDRTQLPYLVVGNKADFKDRHGEVKRKTMRAWDMHNQVLDLVGLNLAGGSIVQPVVNVGIFVSSLLKVPTPSVKLQGVRVLKAVSFGAAGGALRAGDVSQEDLDLLGADFEAEDLSAYVGKRAGGTVPQAATQNAQGETLAADLYEDIPF